LALKKYWRLQNIGVNNMLASTKHWRQQNVCVEKIFVSKKYSRRQNIGVDKILLSTESSRLKNVGACVEASPYCFGPAESAAADFSQTSLMFSYFSLKMLISPCAVNKCAVASDYPAFMGGLSPPLYRLIVLARHAENVTNIGVDNISARRDFTNFCQTIAVNISEASQASYQKLVKTKSDHHHCPISVHIVPGSEFHPLL
jgi:hypothetical protein